MLHYLRVDNQDYLPVTTNTNRSRYLPTQRAIKLIQSRPVSGSLTAIELATLDRPCTRTGKLPSCIMTSIEATRISTTASFAMKLASAF